MLQILGIAATLLPELIKLIAGDKAGKVADDAVKAVTQVTKTDDPAVAQEKIKKDPAVQAELQAKLAQIALEATKTQNEAAAKLQELKNADVANQRQAELSALQQTYDNADKQRKIELDQFKNSLADTLDARSRQAGYVQLNSPMQWAAPVISGAVIIIFFIVLVALLQSSETTKWPDQVTQIINITVGALVAAFTGVVNFWIGSSQGSREKDNAIVQQGAQALQTTLTQSNSAIAAVRTSISAPPASGRVGAASDTSASKPDNFERCLNVTLVQEGGYGDHPLDPGGPTNLGITLKELRDWRLAQNPNLDPNSITAKDVQQLERKEAVEIYRTNYWNKAQCSLLPSGIDLEVFDMAVNAGPSRSIRILQAALGVIVDGSIGPQTLTAAKSQDAKAVINSFSDGRQRFYEGLSTFDTFGKGWTNRVRAVREKALEMVGT